MSPAPIALVACVQWATVVDVHVCAEQAVPVFVGPMLVSTEMIATVACVDWVAAAIVHVFAWRAETGVAPNLAQTASPTTLYPHNSFPPPSPFRFFIVIKNIKII